MFRTLHVICHSTLVHFPMLIEKVPITTLGDQRGFMREEEFMQFLLYMWFSYSRFPLWGEGDKILFFNRKRVLQLNHSSCIFPNYMVDYRCVNISKTVLC